MKDQQVFDQYELFWKEIVENPDGTLNKEQVAKELYDFSVLIKNISKVYYHISDGIISKPMTDADAIIGLFEEQLKTSYNDGYLDARVDYLVIGEHDV